MSFKEKFAMIATMLAVFMFFTLVGGVEKSHACDVTTFAAAERSVQLLGTVNPTPMKGRWWMLPRW